MLRVHLATSCTCVLLMCCSERWFTHASPTLFNAGTPRPQLSSCFLICSKGDSIEGIYDSLKECAVISKSAGVYLHWSRCALVLLPFGCVSYVLGARCGVWHDYVLTSADVHTLRQISNRGCCIKQHRHYTVAAVNCF
jgi:hypothetical protein